MAISSQAILLRLLLDRHALAIQAVNHILILIYLLDIDALISRQLGYR